MKTFTPHAWKVIQKWIIAGASIAILWVAGSKLDAIKLAIQNAAAPDTVVVTPFTPGE